MGPGACLAAHGRANVRRGERREERGERRERDTARVRGLRPPVRGEKAAPGVVLGATFLNVYFMPESGEAEDLF